MSEYKIVNRVHPTPAFAQTVAEVEAQAELDKSLPLVEQVLQNPGVLAELTKKNYEPSAAGVEAMLQKQFGPGSEHCCGNELAEGMKTAEASRVQNPGVLKGLKTEFHVPVPKAGDTMKIPFHVGETIRFVETVEASRAPFVGKSEPETFNQMVSRMAEELGYADPVVKQSEFKDFKERVIRAFKDMGFDTRKFFDE